MKRLIYWCACSLVCVPSASLLFANPSTKTPDTLLEIRPGEKVAGDYLAPDYEAISQRYAKAKALSDELNGKLQADKLALGDGRQVGPLYLLQAALKRDADFLQLRGEACGWDLGLHVAEFNGRLTKIVRKLLTLPGLNLKPLQLQLEKSHAAGLKRLPQIQGLIAQQKFVQAEGELEEIIDDMMRSAVWFPDTDLRSMFQPFRIDLPQAKQLRKDKAVAELQAVVERGPDFAKMQMELTQAATEIGNTGKALWNGQSVSGPELLAAWQANWPKLQATAKSAAMAQWASEQVAGGEAKYAKLLAAQQQFSGAVIPLLATIVKGDTLRASAAEAATLYPQYVAAAASLCAIGPRQELETVFTPALADLAVKAGLDKDVAAYRAAMEPLLAWKRFFARAQAKAQLAKAAPVHEWATKVCAQPYQPHTIIPDPQTNIALAKIASSPQQVLPAVLPAGPPPVIVVSDVVPASAVAAGGLARYHQRVFAIVAAPPLDAWKSAAEQLEQQLLATSQTPPLTLNAATALATARLGIFENVGGPVEQVTIEPLLTRWITLPDSAGAILPLGALHPDCNDPATTFEQGKFLSLGCYMPQPQWFQNECFVLQR